MNLVEFLLDAILYDHVKFVAAGQRITGSFEEVSRLFQIQFQRNGKRNDGRLFGPIVWLFSDFCKMLSIHIGLLIDLRICFSAFINEKDGIARRFI